MTIRKAVIELTVMFDDTIVSLNDFHNMDLVEIAMELDDGEMIGGTRHIHTIEVEPQNVSTELEALGNDGTFFEEA